MVFEQFIAAGHQKRYDCLETSFDARYEVLYGVRKERVLLCKVD